MISMFDFQELLSTAWFEGDLQIAGLAIFTVVLLLIFALTRKMNQSLLLAIPVILIFAALGVLNTDLVVLLIVITVLGLAFTVRNTWR